MTEEENLVKEIGPFGRLVGIFMSPRETFDSIARKPTWLFPFIVAAILTIVMSMMVMDITLKERIADMEARGTPSEQVESAQSMMQSSIKYVSVVITPVGILVVWSILAGVLLLGCNTIMGGETKFKNVFSVVAWTSMVTILGGIVQSFLIVSKGTSQGVSTNLSLFLPLPGIGQDPSILYRLLSKFDLFVMWQLILWIIGLAVVSRLTVKKSAAFVLSLWALYIVVTVALGSVLGPIFGG